MLPVLLSVAFLIGDGRIADKAAVEALLEQGRGSEALTIVEHLLVKESTDPRLETLLIEGLLQTGQRETALDRLLRLGHRFPENTGFHLRRAELFTVLGEDERARQVLEVQRQRTPGSAALLEAIGDTYTRMARSAYGGAFQTNPQADNVRAKLAGITALNRVTGGSLSRPMDRAETRLLRSQVIRTLQSWADAWSTQDSASFQSHYWRPAPDDEKPDGSRRLLSEIAMQFAGPVEAIVSLVEIRRLSDRTEKRYKQVWMTYQDGRWGISQEKVLAP